LVEGKANIISAFPSSVNSELHLLVESKRSPMNNHENYRIIAESVAKPSTNCSVNIFHC
jgi:hypothetical protein